VSGHIHSSRLSAGAGLSGHGLVFAPALPPRPRDRRVARARGTRGSLRRTLVARPALAVAISAPSLLIRRWRKPARTENAAQKLGRPTGQITRICARDFLSRGTEPVPRYRKQYGSDRNSPLALEHAAFECNRHCERSDAAIQRPSDAQ
jgi:hypothetical protein